MRPGGAEVVDMLRAIDSRRDSGTLRCGVGEMPLDRAGSITTGTCLRGRTIETLFGIVYADKGTS